MKCVNPFVRAGEVYPCGQCLLCRTYRARVWRNRILLEASQHEYNSVVTLTYDEAALPATQELVPGHLRDWLKRYRRRALERYPWRYLRFFASAEYGEGKGRPHYHVVLFGQPGCENGRGGRLWCSDCECATCQDVTETWPIGQTSVDSLTPEIAAYVAGYVTRKLSSSTMGRTITPFIRMSLRPGIGAAAMHDVASVVLQYGFEVPTVLRSGSSSLQLGRYLRRKLSDYTDQALAEFALSSPMLAVRDAAFSLSRSQASIYRQINEVYESQISQREALKEKVL